MIYDKSVTLTRYKEFAPGKMSDSLRLALGLENHEIPPHIYRMRNFGYPPGYSLDPPLSTSEGMQFYYKPNAGELHIALIAPIPTPPKIHCSFYFTGLMYRALITCIYCIPIYERFGMKPDPHELRIYILSVEFISTSYTHISVDISTGLHICHACN